MRIQGFLSSTAASLLVLAALLPFVASDLDDDDDEGAYVGANHGSEDEEDSSVRVGGAIASTVFVMEHGFLSGDAPKWLSRGTLVLSESLEGGYEAKLSDAQEFVTLKQEMQQRMAEAASTNQFYALKMFSPQRPERVLQAAIPAKLLADRFEDWHDVLEVNVGSQGLPVSLSYRVRAALGLSLFDHTQVHIMQPDESSGPRVPPKPKAAAGGAGGAVPVDEAGNPIDNRSFISKYWWVMLIVMFLMSSLSGEEPKKEGGGGGGAKK